MNKKGLINEIWIIIILFIVFLVMVCGYWLIATAGPLVVGEGKALTSAISTGVHTNNPGSSLDNATQVAVSTTNGLLGIVEIIVYLMFLGFMIGFVAVCYYIRTYKWLAMIWALLMIGAVVISFIITTSYQQAAASNADINAFYQTWGTNDLIMNYLPYIVGVFGLMSGIVLFVIVSTDSEESTKEIE